MPVEGIDVPDFSMDEKKHFSELKEKSPVNAVKKLMEKMGVNQRDAKYIVTHINVKYGQCNRCRFNTLDREYIKCPNCGALNFNWTINQNPSENS